MVWEAGKYYVESTDMEPQSKKNVAVCFRSGGTYGRAIGSNPHVRGMTPLQHKAAASSVSRLHVNNDHR